MICIRLVASIALICSYSLPANSQVAQTRSYRLAYIEHGDVWVKSAFGRPQRLTSDGANHRPLFSRDGAQLAFLHDQNVCLASMGDKKVNCVSIGQDLLGMKWLVGEVELLVWSRSTVFLLREEDHWTQEVVFSAGPKQIVLDVIGTIDSKSILVSVAVNLGTDLPSSGLLLRSALSLRTPPELRLQLPYTGIFFANLSIINDTLYFWEDPDFSRSRASDGLELFGMTVEGTSDPVSTGVKTLIDSSDMSEASQTGELVVSSVASDCGRETWGLRPLVVFGGVAPGEAKTIESGDATLAPRWSPNADYIAFVRAAVGSKNVHQRRIWSIQPGTGALRRLTPESAYRDEHPIWLTKDSLLFGRVDRHNNLSLWRLGIHNRLPTEIVELPPALLPEADQYGSIDWADVCDVFPIL